jgi:hypothetical protein
MDPDPVASVPPPLASEMDPDPPTSATPVATLNDPVFPFSWAALGVPTLMFPELALSVDPDSI